MNRFLSQAGQAWTDRHDTQRVQTTTAAFRAIAARLAGLPGRKNLVWISSGFPFATPMAGYRSNRAVWQRHGALRRFRTWGYRAQLIAHDSPAIVEQQPAAAESPAGECGGSPRIVLDAYDGALDDPAVRKSRDAFAGRPLEDEQPGLPARS